MEYCYRFTIKYENKKISTIFMNSAKDEGIAKKVMQTKIGSAKIIKIQNLGEALWKI